MGTFGSCSCEIENVENFTSQPSLVQFTRLINAITVVGHEISEHDRTSLVQAQDSDVFCTAMKLFLQSNNFPNTISPALLDRISRTHVDYTVYNNILHKRFTDGRGTIVWRIVVPPALLPNFISQIHSSLQHVSWKYTYPVNNILSVQISNVQYDYKYNNASIVNNLVLDQLYIKDSQKMFLLNVLGNMLE
jgi:hypothetical protein